MLTNLLTSETYLNIAYDPANGSFWRIKKEPEGTRVIRKLLPNYDGMLNALVQGSIKNAYFNTNRKAQNIAWYIAVGDIPEGSVCILKDSEDYRLSNLVLLSKEDYIKYKDAEANNQSTRITYYGAKYRVNYRSANRQCYETFEDEVIAKEFRSKVIKEAREVLDGVNK